MIRQHCYNLQLYRYTSNQREIVTTNILTTTFYMKLVTQHIYFVTHINQVVTCYVKTVTSNDFIVTNNVRYVTTLNHYHIHLN